MKEARDGAAPVARSAGTPSAYGPAGPLPYRLALAGGWIDQPFVSRHNPSPPGSMVTVSLEPICRFMDRSGMAGSTRAVAQELWPNGLPEGEPMALVRELYAAENSGKKDPSGSQDMVGLITPGISRLDYDYAHEGGVLPRQIASCNDPEVISWLERVVYLLPVAPRPEGYNPLGEQHLEPGWIRELGQTGRDCYAAILARDIGALGASLNACMRCWEAILPHTMRHPALRMDLMGLLGYYQARYPGAMYSGCGGGYLCVVAGEPVPGGLTLRVRRGRADG